MLGSKPRKFQRYVVEGMDIHARTVFNMEADVLDLSLSGASIQSTQRLNMGSTYTFKFTRGDNLTSVSGVVVWEKLVGTKKNEKGEMMPVYLAGVQFSDILTDKAQELIDGGHPAPAPRAEKGRRDPDGELHRHRGRTRRDPY